MRQLLRKLALIGAGLALVGTVAGCSPEQKQAILQMCEKNPAECAVLAEALAKQYSPKPNVEAHYMTRDEAPHTLVVWAAGEADSEKPAYRPFTTEANTYLAVTGGPQPTGGYKIRVERVVQEGNVWWVETRLISPGGNATTVIDNPVGYFRFPKLDGEVRVRWVGEQTLTVNAGWTEDGMVKVTGYAKNMADIHIEALLGGDAVISQADAQVKDGYFESNLIIPGGPTNLTLVFMTVDPVAPKVVHTVEIKAPAGDTQPKDEVWSANFRVKKPWLSDKSTVMIEGKARVFEGVFRIEVWAGGKMLAGQPVYAKAGAPAYGPFSVMVTIEGGVPAGAEVRYLVENMKDGGFTTELTVPVVSQ